MSFITCLNFIKRTELGFGMRNKLSPLPQDYRGMRRWQNSFNYGHSKVRLKPSAGVPRDSGCSDWYNGYSTLRRRKKTWQGWRYGAHKTAKYNFPFFSPRCSVSSNLYTLCWTSSVRHVSLFFSTVQKPLKETDKVIKQHCSLQDWAHGSLSRLK